MEPDATRSGLQYSDVNVPLKSALGIYGMSGLMEGGRFLQNPMPAIKAAGNRAVDMVNPIPTFVQAGKSMTEFAQKPSWWGAGKAAFDVGMAGLDATMVGDVAKLGKKPVRSAISRLGRY
jgi:hypothetical protein